MNLVARSAALVILGGVALLLGAAACGAFGGNDSSSGGGGGGSDAGVTADSSAASQDAGGADAAGAEDSGPSIDPCADGGTHRYMFVTHDTYAGDLGSDGGPSGRARADALCNAAARSVHLPGTYIAWLSTATVHPAALPEPGVPVVLPKCEVVADDLPAMATGTKVPPAETEYGEPLGIPCQVWTNTNSNGVSMGSNPAGTCNDWTSVDAGTAGGIGECTNTNLEWAYWGSFPCDNTNGHLYCLQN